MFGIQFLDELARMRGQALVICMSLGCGLSSHSGNNSLALYLNDLAVAYRRCVVTATGNLAAARKHFQGVFTAEDIEEGLGKKRLPAGGSCGGRRCLRFCHGTVVSGTCPL